MYNFLECFKKFCIFNLRKNNSKRKMSHNAMKKIAILDTWINDTNLGNKPIMEASYNGLKEIFPHDFFYHVPALEYIKVGRKIIEEADHVFLAGTNLLSSNMNRTSEWCLRITDVFWMKNVILLGVGWWQYQSYSPNLYSRFLLRQILTKKYYHSVRDSYTAKRLKALGFKVLNTGCPTLWKLDKEHCLGIPRTKARSALLTFTEYNRRSNDDTLLFEIVKRNYTIVYFWPQMYGDYNYAKAISGNNFVFIDPSIEALDVLLGNEDIDYIGTRLHAGIRALQHKRRAIIIGIDNRAIEMGKDFNLPMIYRDKIAFELEEKINGSWATEININQQEILAWKMQFSASEVCRKVDVRLNRC